MASEGASSDSSRERIRAIAPFNSELESLVPSMCTENVFGQLIAKHAVGMFGLNAAEASGLADCLQDGYYTPSADDIDDSPESAVDMLRVGLLMDGIEEYAVLYSQSEFREWIEPFMRSMLLGHIEESASLEHLDECPDERFCSAHIMACYMLDTVFEGMPTISDNELYISYADEIINMKITTIRILEKLSLVTPSEADDVIEDYRDWLDSFDDYPIRYDEALFDPATY